MLTDSFSMYFDLDGRSVFKEAAAEAIGQWNRAQLSQQNRNQVY